MQLTITTSDDKILNLDVNEDLEIENLKAQCEFELSIPSASFVLFCNGRQLTDEKKSLRAHGVVNGDVLLLQARCKKENTHTTVPFLVILTREYTSRTISENHNIFGSREYL